MSNPYKEIHMTDEDEEEDPIPMWRNDSDDDNNDEDVMPMYQEQDHELDWDIDRRPSSPGVMSGHSYVSDAWNDPNSDAIVKTAEVMPTELFDDLARLQRANASANYNDNDSDESSSLNSYEEEQRRKSERQAKGPKRKMYPASRKQGSEKRINRTKYYFENYHGKDTPSHYESDQSDFVDDRNYFKDNISNAKRIDLNTEGNRVAHLGNVNGENY
jgi:hypothetical protein